MVLPLSILAAIATRRFKPLLDGRSLPLAGMLLARDNVMSVADVQVSHPGERSKDPSLGF